MLVSKNLKSFISFSQQLKNTSIPLYGQEALESYLQRADEEKKIINQTPILSVQTQVRFIEQNRNIKAQSKYLQQSNLNNYLFDLQQNQINNELALQLNIDHLSIGSLLIQNLKQAELQYINCKISNQSISPIIFVQAIFDHLQELRQIKQDFMLDNLLKNILYLEKNINEEYIPILELIIVLLQEMNYLKQSTPIIIASILGSIFELLIKRENLLLNYRERKEIKQTGLSFFQKFNSIYNKSQYQKLQYVDFRNMLFTLCLYNHEIPIERQQFIVDEFANFGIKYGNAQKLVELTGYLLICDVQLTQNYFKQILDNRIIRYINFQSLAIMIQAMNQYSHFQTESQFQLYQILFDKLNEQNRDIQKLDFNLDLAFKMVNTLIQMPVMTNKNINEAKIIRMISNLENLCDEDDTLTVNQLFFYSLKLNSIFKYPWALIKEINKQHINLQYDKEQFLEFLEIFIDRYHEVEYDFLLSDQVNIEAPSDQVVKLVTKILSMMNDQLLDERIFQTLIRFGLQDYIPLGDFIQQIIQQNLYNQINKQNVFSFVRYINKYKLKLPQVNEKVLGFIDDFQPLQFFEIVYYLGIKDHPKIQKLLLLKTQEFFTAYQASRMNYFKIESFYQTYSQNSQLSYKGLQYIVPLIKNIELEHKDIAKLDQIIERNCKQFYGDILIENLIGITELGIRNINIFKKCVDNITSVFRYNKQTDILGIDGILRNKNFQLQLVQSYLSQVEENESQHYVGYKIIGYFASKVFQDLIDIELIALMKLLGNDPNNYTNELLKQLKSFKFSDKYIFDAARYAPYQDQSFIQYLNKWLQNNKIKTFKQLQSFQSQQIHINNIDSVYLSLEKEQPTQIMQIKQQILSYLIDCYQQGIQMEKFMWAANQSYAKLDIQSQKSFIIIKALDQISKKIHLEVTDHLTLKERKQQKYTKALLDKINQLLLTEELGVCRSQIQNNDVEYYPSLVMDKQENNPRWIAGFTPIEIESVDQTLLQFLFYQPSVKQSKINAMIKFVIQELQPPEQIIVDNSLKYLEQRQNNQKKDEDFINFFGPFWSAIDQELEPRSTSLCDSSHNTVDISIQKAIKNRNTLDVYLASQQDVVYINDKVALSPFMQLLALNQSLFNPTLVILYEPWIKKNYTKFIQEKFIQSIIEQL